MPGPLSRFFHHLPGRMHKTEVVSNHAAQLVLPFGLFLPQPVPDGCALLIIITQLWLMLSGNFAWLNALTIVLAVSALDDSVLGSAPAAPAGPLWHTALVLAVGLGVLVLSAWPVRNMLGKRQVMNASFNKLHLGNTYGAFGSITRVRHEVILEGTADATGDTGWREYRFKGKPGDPTRRSPQVAPYHLRLDWAMWFLPIAPGYGRVWFPRLIRALLQGDEELTALLRENPFAGEPPRRVRARLFRYRFTTARERRETGAWWSREPVADFFPATSLSEMD